MDIETKNLLESLHNKFIRREILTVVPISVVAVSAIGASVFFGYFNTQVKLVPPSMQKEMTSSRSYIDTEYLSEMSAFVMNMRFTVNPSSCSHNFGQLLNYVDDSSESENYGRWRGMLSDECKSIIHYHISSSIFIKDEMVNTETLTDTMNTMTTKYVDGRALDPEEETYNVKWSLHGGLHLLAIQKVEKAKK